MDRTETARRPRRTRAVAALMVMGLTLTAGAVFGTPAPAGAGAAPTTGMTWRFSTQAFTSSSLTPAHDVVAPATKGPEAWVYPTVTGAAWDPATKAGTATFPGGFVLGNTAQGNYRMKFESFILTIEPGGTDGKITANVSYALAPASGDHVYNTPVRATVADLTFAEGSIVDQNNTITFTTTPDFVLRTDLAENPNGFRQFPQEMLSALDPSLISHFRETGLNQPNKAPAAVTISFPYTPPPPAAGLLWKISETAFTSSSLSPAHATEAPATKTTGGFSFVEPTNATYDPENGEGQLDFTGSVTLGNTAQGNYRIKIANPSLLLSGGTGDLVADVSYALFDMNTQQLVWSTVVRTTVADLTLPDGAVTLDGDLLSFSVTPDFVVRTDNPSNPAWRQFPQGFLDALNAQLVGFFRETGAGSDANKAPAVLSLTDVQVEVSTPPTDDEYFVQVLYGNVLGRAVDESALTYWTGRLGAGTSRQAVANAVSGSAEARAILVRFRYEPVGRQPSASEISYWTGRVAAGMTAEDLTLNLLGSPEAYANAGGTGDGLATRAYQTYLRRSPDPAGLAYWSGRLGVDQTSAARKSALRTFGRLAPSTTAAVRSAISSSCGSSTPVDTAQTAALEAAWVQGGRNPVRLNGYATVIVCPQGPTGG